MKYELPFHTTFYWSKKKALQLDKVTLSEQEVGTYTIHVDGDEQAEKIAEKFVCLWLSCYIDKKPLPDLPLNANFTPFTRMVLEKTAEIPQGSTKTYSEIAHLIGKPDAHRAVARALGSNPFPLIIPCHRVIGKDGALRGFREGIEVKKALLDFERENTR